MTEERIYSVTFTFDDGVIIRQLRAFDLNELLFVIKRDMKQQGLEKYRITKIEEVGVALL